MSLPSDYWNQFLLPKGSRQNVPPPYNPATHHSDGTPLTPDIMPGKDLRTFNVDRGNSLSRLDFDKIPATSVLRRICTALVIMACKIQILRAANE